MAINHVHESSFLELILQLARPGSADESFFFEELDALPSLVL